MHAVADAAQSTPVTDEDRGADIQRRLDRLGISDREFQARTGIDRKTLRRAVDGEEKVRASTYDAIEAGLDKLERLVSGLPAAQARPVGDPADDLIEVRLEGNFGVRAVVKGSAHDPAALKEIIAFVLREMNTRGELPEPPADDDQA